MLRFSNLDTNIDINDMKGNILPAGVIKTITPPLNKDRVTVNVTLAAIEFFTNYDKELIEKIREHKVNTGVWF
jgi:hypothetical protein